MNEIIAASFARPFAGLLGGLFVPFVAGLVLTGCVAVLKGRGWKGLGISLALMVLLGFSTFGLAHVGEGSATPAANQAGTDVFQFLLPWGLISGAGIFVVLSLPILLRHSTR